MYVCMYVLCFFPRQTQALNTLMGREVYTSNEQLGGAGVMGPNGISHQLVDSHIGAVASALRWLSYVPSSRGAYLPVVRYLFSIQDVWLDGIRSRIRSRIRRRMIRSRM